MFSLIKIMDPLSPSEQVESDKAQEYVRTHEKELIKKFADPKIYIPDSQPVSLFMAGSPGAGKTETSKRLIETFHSKPVRIDADEIREFIPWYDGMKAYLFQRAANKGVNMLFDFALHKNINLILDGTFAYEGVEQNIRRSLERNRQIVIYYIFQEPKRAWEVVLAREAIEHRRVSKDVFIRSFIAARNNIDMIKEKFGPKIQLNIIAKDFAIDSEKIELAVPTIDQYLPKVYNEDELKSIIEV